MKRAIALIPGDGIGPEVMKTTQEIIKAGGVEIEWETLCSINICPCESPRFITWQYAPG